VLVQGATDETITLDRDHWRRPGFGQSVIETVGRTFSLAGSD